MSKRRVFSPQQKAGIALASVKGEKSLSELASGYAVHPNQVSQWKKQFWMVISFYQKLTE